MNFLNLVWVFGLIVLRTNWFVVADLNCTWHSLEENITFFKYRCIFACDEGYNKVDKIGVRVDSAYEQTFIDELTLENCSFDDESTWKGAWYLKKLNVSSNHLTKIPKRLFSGDIIIIEQLNISNNFIEEIDPSTFKAIPNLLRLDLSHNDIKYLHENAFDTLIHLKELDLSFNPIENLQIETFAYLQQLEILSFKHTKLNSIQLGIFLYQHNLKSLDLSENNLKTVNFEQHSPIFHDLLILYLSKNHLTDLNGFHNKIFPQLRRLDIRANHFTCTYLQGFIERIDWSKLRLVNNPQLTKEHKAHVRGVNCEIMSNSENKVANSTIT